MSTQDTATVLFSTPFTYERLGDHVDEIKFIQPVLVTHIRVADIAPPKAGSASQPPQLRIFARDLQCLGSSRFAPLCTSTISCQESGAQTYRTEVILTDHVIIRGRYTAVEFTLLGSTEAADDLDPQGKAEASANSAAAAVAAARRAWCSADGLAGAATPASAPPSVVSLLQSPGVLPVAAMPARMLTALQSAAAYYTEVGRSHGRIASNPPQGRLRAIMSAADTLYQALQGETSALEAAVAAEPLKVEDAHVLQRFVATAVELAVDWCQLLASDRSSTVTEVSVGLAGLAVALVLCSYPPTAATFMRAGGVTAATGILALPRPSSDMLRYASALCEMLTLSQGAAGCEVLLGWWVPPPLQVLAKEEEDVSMADVKSEGQQTPRTGVSGSVIKSEAEDRHGAAGGMEVDGGTLSLAEDGNGRTRDGGGHFGGVAGGGGSGSWAGLNGDEDDGTDQFYRNASNAPGRSAEVEEADAQEGAEEGAEHEQFAAEGEDAEQHAPAEVGSAEHEQAEDEEAAAAAAAPYNEQDDDGGHHVDDEAAAAALEEDELVAADDDEEPDAYGDLYGDVGGAEVDAEEDADEATGAAGGGGDEAAIGTSAGKRDGSDDEVAASMDLDGPAEEGGTAGQRGTEARGVHKAMASVLISSIVPAVFVCTCAPSCVQVAVRRASSVKSMYVLFTACHTCCFAAKLMHDVLIHVLIQPRLEAVLCWHNTSPSHHGNAVFSPHSHATGVSIVAIVLCAKISFCCRVCVRAVYYHRLLVSAETALARRYSCRGCGAFGESAFAVLAFQLRLLQWLAQRAGWMLAGLFIWLRE